MHEAERQLQTRRNDKLASVAQSCPILCDPVDCSPPGSSVHGTLQARILECEVRQALGSVITNKASGGDGIPAEVFQVLKDGAVKVPANLENSAVAIGLEKVEFHFNPKEGQSKECWQWFLSFSKPSFNIWKFLVP